MLINVGHLLKFQRERRKQVDMCIRNIVMLVADKKIKKSKKQQQKKTILMYSEDITELKITGKQTRSPLNVKLILIPSVLRLKSPHNCFQVF